ncbi:hypothetical protein EW093_13750 [Thiospirochaeta perfilievii]|uniref:DUF5723 domain-containing protein n=1 Tax=Thiospirochaeta perfilievii TaxID=252967 RepID=A0A5C1QDR9_9SPIO|nr:hypothetical protein [Thiospirochaeta perfilievii]QEN05731.1 hypothetical protein EW093_13750 [Thiospirochaeta perfilievii]
MVQGFDSFYNNPGLLAYYDDEISFFKLNVNLKGDALDVLNLYLGGDLSPDDPAALLTTLQDKGLTNLLVGLDINGPLSIGVIGNNWGWYLKNSTNVYLDLPGITSTADIVLREDLVFSAGIAVPFKMRFGDSFFLELVPGVMSRTTLRAELRIEEDLLGFMGYMSDFSSLLADFPLNISPMFALDAGFVINVYDIVSLSGVVKDIYTPILKYPVSSLSDALGIFTSGNDTTGNLVYREINFGLSSDIPLEYYPIL